MKSKFIGFRLRFVASIIDSFIWLSIWLIISYLIAFSPLSPIMSWIFAFAVYFIIGTLYEIILTSRFGGTVGKILMRCKVIDSKGGNISIKKSTGRYFAKILSGIILGIGYLMIIWDGRKQGVHDKLAGTFVANNTKSRIPNKLKKAVIILTIAAIVIYAVLFVLSVISIVSSSFEAAYHKLDPNDPVGDLQSICNSKPSWQRDRCIATYSLDPSMVSLHSSTRLETCLSIESHDIHLQCILPIVMQEKDPGLCSSAKSEYHELSCRKSIAWLESIGALKAVEKHEFNGTLDIGDVYVGFYDEYSCLKKGDVIFYLEDTICFEFINVSGFKIGEDDLHWYDIDVRIFNKEGRLVSEVKEIYKEDGHMFLRNNVLDSTLIWSKPGSFGPGEYTYELAIYDRVSDEGTIINRTITVMEEEPQRALIMEELNTGSLDDYFYDCERKNSSIFLSNETICFIPVAKGFEIVGDENIVLDIGLRVSDSNGELVEYDPAFYEDLTLVGEVLQEEYVYLYLGDFEAGEYVADITVVDKVGKGRVSGNVTFFVDIP